MVCVRFCSFLGDGCLIIVFASFFLFRSRLREENEGGEELVGVISIGLPFVRFLFLSSFCFCLDVLLNLFSVSNAEVCFETLIPFGV
jgi:hypothetical protein